MGLFRFFIDPRGRIGRQQYWLGMLGVALAIAALIGTIWTTGQLLLGIPLIAFIAVSVYSLAIKRLHDRNKTGWWTLLFIALPTGLDRLGNRFPEDSFEWWVVALVSFALSLWGVIEIGFRRGTDGENEYGPDPIGKPEVTAPAV